MARPIPTRGLLVGLALAGGAFLLLPWLQVRPNRIAEGEFLSLLSSSPFIFAAVWALWLVPLALVRRPEQAARAAWAAGFAAPLVLAVAAALQASALAPADTPVRVSLSWGFWTTALLGAGAAITFGEASVARRSRAWASAGAVILVAAGLAAGHFDGLSLVREYRAQAETFWKESLQHLVLSGTAVAAGTVLGLAAGWGASRLKSVRRAVFFFLNLVQTLPSLALFGLLIVPLSVFGLGIGPVPALLVLSVYAAFPIARSTLTALENLDPAVLDAGKGLGMSRPQIFWRIQVPLALPVVLTGVRTASVQAVGNTVVAALIGAGGLGALIFFGLGQYAPDLILLGTFPALALALAVDQLWALVLPSQRRQQ